MIQVCGSNPEGQEMMTPPHTLAGEHLFVRPLLADLHGYRGGAPSVIPSRSIPELPSVFQQLQQRDGDGG